MPLFNRHPFYYTKSIIYPWQPPPPPVPLEIGNDSDDGSVFSSSDDAEMEEDTEDTSDDALNPPDAQQNIVIAKTPMGSEEGKPENKFLTALMNAAQSYSSRMRVPSTVVPSQSATFPPPVADLSASTTFTEVDDASEMVYAEDDFSSEDEETDFSKPVLNAKDASQLFYMPTGEWARHANEPIENPVVIAKLNDGAMCEAYIKQGTIRGRQVTYISKTWLLCQVWEGFFSEMALYAHPSYLRPLQGTVIPTIIGVYLAEGKVSIAMELPSSKFWVEASDDMSDDLKRSVLDAFAAVHARGVLHNDVELRHMLISAEGNVTLIDFQMSKARVPIAEVGLEQATEADLKLEARQVRYKLNYGDAQRIESERRTRVEERKQRNAQRVQRRQIRQKDIEESRWTGAGDVSDDEPEDNDVIENPIVEPCVWRDCWLGELTEPDCYVVPNQDETEVRELLRQFALKEARRQGMVLEGNEGASTKDTQLKGKSHISLPPTTATAVSGKFDRLISPAVANKENASSPPTRASGMPSAQPSSSTQPPSIPVFIPTPLPRKRKRNGEEDSDIEGGFSSDTEDDEAAKSRRSPPRKRVHIEHPASEVTVFNVTEIERVPSRKGKESAVRPLISAGPSTSRITPSFPNTTITDASRTASAKPAGVVRDSVLPNVIHIPYEGYTGRGGYTIPNTYNDEETAQMRREWIRMSNMMACLEERLSYPYPTRNGEPPVVDSDGDGDDETEAGPSQSSGQKRKKSRHTKSRGALKRAKLELERPGKRMRDAFRRREKYFDQKARELGWNSDDESQEESSDDGFGETEDEEERPDVEEGPRVITWDEYEARKVERPDIYPHGGRAIRRKRVRSSILRRKLAVEERVEQYAYEESLYLLNIHPNRRWQSSDDDDNLPLRHYLPIAPTHQARHPRPSLAPTYVSANPPSRMFIPLPRSRTGIRGAKTSRSASTRVLGTSSPTASITSDPSSRVFIPLPRSRSRSSSSSSSVIVGSSSEASSTSSSSSRSRLSTSNEASVSGNGINAGGSQSRAASQNISASPFLPAAAHHLSVVPNSMPVRALIAPGPSTSNERFLDQALPSSSSRSLDTLASVSPGLMAGHSRSGIIGSNSSAVDADASHRPQRIRRSGRLPPLPIEDMSISLNPFIHPSRIRALQLARMAAQMPSEDEETLAEDETAVEALVHVDAPEPDNAASARARALAVARSIWPWF